MNNLKDNLDHYMWLKGIKSYSRLLTNIAYQLGIKGEKAYDFAQREKANFSKMLKGDRPLKYDFIIPLETILGVSLAKMKNEEAYKLPTEKGDVPFSKGFRYYAYLDDPKLYKDEMDVLLGKNGETIFNRQDEFGKTFLDYVVEYRAVNGVRYLYEQYGITLKWYYNSFDLTRGKGSTWLLFDNCIAFARLVASMNDADLFNGIYDSYNMFYRNGHYGGSTSIFYQPDYLEILLDNEAIFKSLFEYKTYTLKLGNIAKRARKTDTLTYNPCFNPILNNCLKHALTHLDKYKKQAIEILKFGIAHNRETAKKYDLTYCWVCNELGGMKNSKDDNFYECVIIVGDIAIKDNDIKRLIDELPTFYSSF